MSNAKFDCGMKRMRTRAAMARMALLTSTALCLSFAAPATVLAQSDVETDTSEQGKEFNIPPSDMGKALDAYAEQADVEIIYSDRDVAGKLSNGVHGTYPRDAALDELIGSSGLKYTINDDGVIVIQAASLEVKEAAAERPMMRVAEVATEEKAETSGYEAGGAERERDKVVVTGTRIKGVKDQFSPVTQVSRDEMDLAGFANVAEVVESLPQNFGGGITPETTGASNGNGLGGAGVNLRGLGNQATLVLLNGRRFAPGGFGGNFVDISTIPTSAIERVEVLTDGASAIYGADAIAGVVNIILRDDFDGAESRLNVGTISDGGGDYLKAAQTLGWSGNRAHAMVTYEYSVEEELDANQKEFSASQPDPTWLLPFSQKHSVFASTGVQLSDRIKLSADGYFNDRKSKQYTSADSFVVFQAFQVTDVQQYGAALALDVELDGDWESNLSGSFSKSDQFSDNIQLSGIGDQFKTITEVLSFDGSVGGPLFSITDDPVRGVFGAQYRSEQGEMLSVRTPAQTVVGQSDKSRNVYAVFGELYAPIISKSNGVPGIESLAITTAVRYEGYSDVGSSLLPKFGLAWSPYEGLNLRGTYGKSFRAPRLDQLVDSVGSATLGVFVDPNAPGGESVAITITGSRDNLDPETSRTWSAGFDFSPPSLDKLLLRGTYFNIVFEDQVGSPSVTLDSSFRYIDFTGIPTSTTPAAAVDFCARAKSGCFNLADFFPSLGPITFNDVAVLLDRRAQNLALSKVAGLDFEGSYGLTSGFGDWRFSLGGTLLTTFEQQAAPFSPSADLLNTFNNPVDLKLRGGAQWRSGVVNSAVFVNHVGDYLDDEVPSGDVPIDSFTTIDATIRIDLTEVGRDSLLDGASLSFSVLNMFNEDPPFITEAPTRLVTYDATNGNPTGRKIGLLLTKRW